MSPLDFGVRNYLKLSMFERWGVIPAAGDRHLAEFVPWILTEDTGWGEAWGVHLTPMSKREEDQADFIDTVERQLAGTEPLHTWPSGEMMAMVVDSLTTGEPRELPVNIPNAGQCPDLPLGRRRRVDVRGRRRRRARARPGHRPAGRGRAAAPPRRHPGAHRRGGGATATATWPCRRSPSTRWPAGASCATSRPWPTSCWPAPPAGSLRTSDRTGSDRATRIHRAGGHGPAHDPQPARGGPPGDRGVARAAARSTPPSASARSTAGSGRRGPGQRARVPLPAQLPRGGRGARRAAAGHRSGPPDRRLLHDRSRHRAAPARAGRRHRRRLPRGAAVGRHDRRREGHAHPDGRRRRRRPRPGPPGLRTDRRAGRARRRTGDGAGREAVQQPHLRRPDGRHRRGQRARRPGGRRPGQAARGARARDRRLRGGAHPLPVRRRRRRQPRLERLEARAS